jgi:hypothetical protein
MKSLFISTKNTIKTNYKIESCGVFNHPQCSI